MLLMSIRWKRTGVAEYMLWSDKGSSSSVAADLPHWTCSSMEKISVGPGMPLVRMGP